MLSLPLDSRSEWRLAFRTINSADCHLVDPKFASSFRDDQRKLDVIAVWKLDRFGRSLRHLVDALAELKAVGCAFVSLRDNLDLTTPAGRMMFHVIGAMAEFERELIRERIKAGLVHARSKGRELGRPKSGVTMTETPGHPPDARRW